MGQRAVDLWKAPRRAAQQVDSSESAAPYSGLGTLNPPRPDDCVRLQASLLDILVCFRKKAPQHPLRVLEKRLRDRVVFRVLVAHGANALAIEMKDRRIRISQENRGMRRDHEL